MATTGSRSGPVRWGILGTANIARASFLPGLRAAGGRALAVAGRERDRTEAYAGQHGIEKALVGYDTLIEDPDVEAVYVPLPNSLHRDWTIRALRAQKAVLTEKPLGLTLDEAEAMVQASVESGAPLWEAFVFVFRPHFEQVREWICSGAIGELEEVDAHFSFRIRSETNIRLQRDLGGGALYDVGCYPVHLATSLFERAGVEAAVIAERHPGGVDAKAYGAVQFRPGRLLFSSSLLGGPDTSCRITGSEGSIVLSNPFHPGDRDWMALVAGGRVTMTTAGDGQPSFTAHIAHINRVVRGEEAPRFTAGEAALHTARTLDRIREAAGLDR